jgi:hypothetical protein
MSTPQQTAPLPAPPAPAGPGVLAWRIAGGLVAAGLVLFAALSAVADFTEHRSDVETTYAQPVSRIVVDASTGSVELAAGAPGSPVVVTRTSRWTLGSAAGGRDGVADGVLTLHGTCTGMWLCTVAYRVAVPPGTPVTVTTSTGSITAGGLDGDLDVTTSTGSVDLTGLRSSHVAAEASTGSIELSFAAAPQDVRAQTSTGSVEVVVPPDGTAYAVHASTSIGGSEVTVPVDSSSARRIQARASTGSVEVRPAP